MNKTEFWIKTSEEKDLNTFDYWNDVNKEKVKQWWIKEEEENNSKTLINYLSEKKLLDEYNTIEPFIKNELKSRTDKAFKLGIFGAPSFLVNNKIFWGQDRLEFAINEAKK